jgi:predicted small lipoprotein YifL
MRIIGIMLLLTIFLQGCGHKGPLILSPLPAANPQAAPAQPSTEKSESKKEP